MREERRREAILVAVALSIRVAWIADLSRMPFFDLPTGDALFYARRAAEIAGGSWIGSGLAYPSSPLYPYLIAPFLLLPGRAAFAALYVAQAALDAANVVLLRRLAGRLFGAAAGWIAGIAWAFYGLAVFFAADIVEACAASFLADLALLLLLTRRTPGAEGPAGSSPGRALGAGLALGAAALLRPHFLPLLPLAAGIAAWLGPRGARLRAAASVAAGASLLLGLSLARNVAASGEPVLVSPYSGLNAYLGNRRGANGYLTFPVGVGLRNDMDLRDAAALYPQAVEGRALSAAQVSRFWWRETAREIAADPRGWVRLLARKAWLLAASREPANHLDFGFFRAASIPLAASAVPFGVLSPLAVVGAALVISGAAPSREARALVVLLAAYGGVTVLFFVADRFRLPATGWIAALAAGALSWVLGAARSRRGAAAAIVAATVVLGLLLHAREPERRGAREHVLIAAALAGRGRVEEAERLLRRAVEIDPGSAVARYNLGRILARTGRGPEAIAAFEETLRLAPDFAAAHAALADLEAAAGTAVGSEGARRHREEALRLEPYGPIADRLRLDPAGAGVAPRAPAE